MKDIAQKVLKGDARAVARLITLTENNDPVATEMIDGNMMKGGSIAIDCKNGKLIFSINNNDDIIITVEDSGHGMNKGDLDKVKKQISKNRKF